MIISFKHKGLEKFFRTGSTAGIIVSHKNKLNRILTVLENATDIQTINLPGYDLHKLSGALQEHWSVKVNGNWRITFKFENGDVEIVNYQDYH
ncbi:MULTISPECIES: type II toxin-antitoxin system RelE/ParE family toxin [Pasteurellaceae]|uniref:Type II toxin-antitoxin system RelE/ParE family toxin n=1 Tax=Pasteurella atlantica TaxID=2827233 RepID=A0AAW8CI57_9PAST|nr:type II toxin-antitoxin system RelE/ParE family toxin [Pasteurella atlantica]MBR0573749.1 type II toxin-antitoxin system RelE/ParE family toxin [Pasteurella atlantica]MDP8039616.1 type II toxin-antitoxin system RelE/ParE family toxin [Pasteurella atlantica]MDP8041707.1 type II toxin-antitoxin system RelE/ParE family toxin [Pasteurella atlantica]MDP8044019.1 type II toxin-antitoxin system RelE/ParE family toxin [Pasteurella atlantica]MDP8045997.1 type II toxin-antitoxin system RelE/ParE fami